MLAGADARSGWLQIEPPHDGDGDDDAVVGRDWLRSEADGLWSSWQPALLPDVVADTRLRRPLQPY